jgi:hypothetical protein
MLIFCQTDAISYSVLENKLRKNIHSEVLDKFERGFSIFFSGLDKKPK